tara:strand:- start:617 stop:2803 length:2187 start_codon:yes stop_codon:yes gene_type:complete
MKKKSYIYLLLIILPFLLLLPYTIQYFEVGNDFELYYFSYKKYIFELLKLGHIPFWSPIEASGTSLIFNPLAQFFYIPSWIFYLICLLIGDLTKYYFLIYTIFAISIFNLGLYFYLKTLNINYKVILVTIFITGLSLKVTELLRFPNAIHAFAWFPWIFYGINLAASSLNSKKSLVIILISCLMLLTAGYPYYIFYAFVLFASYCIFLLIPSVKYQILNSNISNKIFLIRCLIPSVLALIISSPWLLKISQLVSITYGRNSPDINFSLNLSSNIYDQIGSWIYPPISYAEGWFYFGSISVLIIITILVSTIIFRTNNIQLKYFSYFLIFLIFFSYQLSNPIDSIIFKHLWENLNFIQGFRHWVRFNLILVPIISVVLAYSINEFLRILNQNEVKNKKILYIFTFSIISIISAQTYFIFISNYQNLFWETWQLKRIIFASENLPSILSLFVYSYNNFIYPIFFVISFILLISILRLSYFKKVILKNKNIYFYLILVISFSELFFLSNIQWAIPYGYYDNGYKKLSLKNNYNAKNDNAILDLELAFKSASVSSEKSGNNRFEGNTYYRNNKKFNVNHINNWGNHYHVKLFKDYFELNGEFKKNLDIRTIQNVKTFYGMNIEPKRIFYSKNLDHKNIASFLEDSKNGEIDNKFSYEIISYNGDELEIIAKSNKNGWVSFIDTWDHNWKVTVNNKPKEINKLLNAYKAVKIKPGESEIKFFYDPINFNFSKN